MLAVAVGLYSKAVRKVVEALVSEETAVVPDKTPILIPGLVAERDAILVGRIQVATVLMG